MNKTVIVDCEDNLNKARSIVRAPQCIIFDLDGTLVNTIDDLGLACDYLLEKHGIEPKWTVEDYKNFVGNGAKLLVKRAFENKLSEDELNSIYEEFKIKYDEIKLEHAHVYPGMLNVVKALKNAGITLVVCTNKPDIAAKGMINSLFPENIFDVVQGALDNKPKKPNPLVPAEILNNLCVKTENSVWIGDSNVDIESAHNLGCPGIGVTWGFRPAENLISAGADLILNNPKDILKIFEISIDNA